jgi:hypothetical protein
MFIALLWCVLNCLQLRELLLKYWLVYWRTPSYTLARCFLTLCVAFIYGSMYFKAAVMPKPYAAMGNVQNIMGIMFSSTSFLGMTNLMAVMPLVGENMRGRASPATQFVDEPNGTKHRNLPVSYPQQ